MRELNEKEKKKIFKSNYLQQRALDFNLKKDESFFKEVFNSFSSFEAEIKRPELLFSIYAAIKIIRKEWN